jgi:hypothetical protein
MWRKPGQNERNVCLAKNSFMEVINEIIPQRHLYFDVVVGLAKSHDPESYAGGSLLLVGPPMPDRSKVMAQTKRDAKPSKDGITLTAVVQEMPLLGRHRLIPCEP